MWVAMEPFPRSKIFTSSATTNTVQPPPIPPTDASIKNIFTLDGKQGPTHFYVIQSYAHSYTRDLLDQCDNRLNCFACARPIAGRVFLYPVRVNEQGVYECSPMPHCRAECMAATVQTISNNFDLHSHLFNMYGDITPAPPRELLYGPRRKTLEEYHALANAGVVVQIEPPNVQSFVGPVYLSFGKLENHQLMASSHLALERLAVQNAADITESQMHQNGPVTQVLPKTNIFTGPLSVFDVDPGTFLAGIESNVHMAQPK